MSFSSGTFTLVAGNPVVTGTTISSTVQNNTMSDVATGLTICLLKDGTQTATAAVPFAEGITIPTGKSVTGAGTATVTGFATVSATALAGSLNGSVGGVTPAAGSFTTGAFSGVISSSLAGENVKHTTTANGTEGTSQYTAWYRSNGTTRKGYIGFGSNDSATLVLNSTAGIQLTTTLLDVQSPVTATGVLKTTGALATDTASSTSLAMSSVTNGRIYVQGSDGSTNASWDVLSTRSDGSNPITLIGVSSAGAVTIPGTLALTATASPTGTGAGAVGQIAWDTSYLYICTATNDWRRAALTDF